ncbi:MAG: glucosamine-6-phosphate deaminase [Rhodothermales bacterium]
MRTPTSGANVAFNVSIFETKQELGANASAMGAARIRTALRHNGAARIVLATGASQFEMLRHLARETNVDWSRVAAFHLDEYIGLPRDHGASFRRYLKERFVDRLAVPIGVFHYINPDEDPEAECKRLSTLIADGTIDVAFIGIGENGHLAFNDPPADFETEAPYLVVSLDEACRRQQWGEGWFSSLEAVPREAVSMSVRQIMKAKAILCSVPDARKATAVRDALEGPVTREVPASILQRHSECHVLLDPPAASKLSRLEKRMRLSSR